jgi:hypothetical protein
MSSVWISVVVIPLVLTELSGWAAWLAAKVARCAARRLGEPGADIRYAEVTATVAVVPGPLTQLVAAVGILAATPALRRVRHAIPEALTRHCGHKPKLKMIFTPSTTGLTSGCQMRARHVPKSVGAVMSGSWTASPRLVR